MRPVTGVLLAAGAGRRFGVHGGTHKLLQPLPGGEPLAVAAGRNLVAAVPHSVAVVRAGDLRLAAALGAVGLRIVEHGGADGGIGTSLAAGVAAAPDAAGWLIALGDMPWVQPETISALTHPSPGRGRLPGRAPPCGSPRPPGRLRRPLAGPAPGPQGRPGGPGPHCRPGRATPPAANRRPRGPARRGYPSGLPLVTPLRGVTRTLRGVTQAQIPGALRRVESSGCWTSGPVGEGAKASPE